jgi:hypothetical protein
MAEVDKPTFKHLTGDRRAGGPAEQPITSAFAANLKQIDQQSHVVVVADLNPDHDDRVVGARRAFHRESVRGS